MGDLIKDPQIMDSLTLLEENMFHSLFILEIVQLISWLFTVLPEMEDPVYSRMFDVLEKNLRIIKFLINEIKIEPKISF